MMPPWKRNMYLPGIHHVDFRPSEEPWLMPPDRGGGGSGGAHEIRFQASEVICDEYTGEVSVMAEWTHYSVSCTATPPGADPYTGLVRIYDSCIFEYYTVAFLATASGRATYWYSPTDCTGKWIVDSICGIPECS